MKRAKRPAAISLLIALTRDALENSEAEVGADLGRGAFAGLDRTVEVALRVLRGVLTGEVAVPRPLALDAGERGVLAKKAEIDARITATAENWRLSRMLPADRNVLRLGVYEIAFAENPTPAAVAINEAIELARRFGSADSPAFVNGVLDKIAKSPAPAPPAPVAI